MEPLQISVILKMLQPRLVTVRILPVNNEMCPLLTADMLPLLLQAAAEGRKWSGGGGGGGGWGRYNMPICDEPGWRGAVAAPVLRGRRRTAAPVRASCPVLQSREAVLLGDTAFVSSPQLLLHQQASWGRSEVSEPRAGPH